MSCHQIHPVHGGVPSGLEARTAQAYALWQVTGWSAWSCGVAR